MRGPGGGELVLVLAGVVHSVDLGHAVGQVAEEPRPDLGVNPFTGGEEPGDFVHALAETSTVFPQDGRVGVQSSCKSKWKSLVSDVLSKSSCKCSVLCQDSASKYI